MKKTIILAAAMAMSFAGAGKASGQGANGTLALTGEVDASLILTFHQNTSQGITINSGDGTATAGASLSTISMYGTADGLVSGTNFTKSKQSDGFTLTGVFDYQVDKANVSSSNFTLAASLQTADNLQWTLNGSGVANGSQTQLTNNGLYGTRYPTTLAVKVPNTEAAGSKSNTIVFTVTCN